MSLSSNQRVKVTKLCEFTGLQEKEAKTYLTATNWNLEAAIECFFNQEIAQPQAPPPTKSDLIESLFQRYKSSASDDIEREGIQEFCSDISIDPLDPVILVIAYYCKAEIMGIFRRPEFTQGLKALGCDSIQKLKAKVPELREQLSEPKSFKQIYNYIFSFSRESGCRNLNIEVAFAMWRLLLSPRFPLVERWIAFLEGRAKKHDISKDTWDMLLDFLEIMEKEGMTGYDPNSSWPVLIDEFVEVLNSSNS